MLLLTQGVVTNVRWKLIGHITCHRAPHNSLYRVSEATVPKVILFYLNAMPTNKLHRHSVWTNYIFRSPFLLQMSRAPCINTDFMLLISSFSTVRQVRFHSWLALIGNEQRNYNVIWNSTRCLPVFLSETLNVIQTTSPTPRLVTVWLMYSSE
jgi:hypothetical protein